ncbi:MAG: hypothetical protein IH588_00760 [Anaerolineales bacterium]|nr:hypothetical protein [Anaerolineales bacterium]
MIINIPIHDLKKPPVLKFPERCAYCGRPKTEMLGITLNMGVQNRNQPVTLQLSVPMCKTCADKERGIAKVTLIPFLTAGLIIGVIVFIPVMLLAPEGTTPQTIGFPFVLGGFAGLVVGVIGGTMVEFVVKTLSVPFYGKLLTRRPLTIFGMFADTDELIGISAKLLREKKIVRLEFENEEIAREFIQLNSLEPK